uniref:Uncharacterized protein n=1 Tax=Arundo donax TaxID=35708 RepID=A0A0A9BWA2_ARUDO
MLPLLSLSSKSIFIMEFWIIGLLFKSDKLTISNHMCLFS